MVRHNHVQRASELRGGHARAYSPVNDGGRARGSSTGVKEAVYCASLMGELDFEETFKCVPIHIDNTSALHVTGNKTYSLLTKLVALRLFSVREIVEEGKISIRHIPTEFNTADIGTTLLSKHRHRYLIGVINNFKT